MRQLAILLQRPLGVLKLGLRWRKAPVLGLHHIGMQASADAKAALARRVRFRKGTVGVADAARNVRRERGRARRNPQRPRRQLHLALAVHKLVKAHEHLHAQIPGHIVARRPAKIPDARAGRCNFVSVSHAHGRLNVRPDFNRAGAYPPLRLQLRDDFVHPSDFSAVFRLGVIHLHQPRPDHRVQVRFHQVVINPAHRIGAALINHRNAPLDQVAGRILKTRRHRVLQIHIDEVAAAMPGVVNETRRNNGHRQAGALQPARVSSHRKTSWGKGHAYGKGRRSGG